MTPSEIKDCDVNRLLASAQSGDASAFDALLHRFKRLVRLQAGAYFIIGGDRDDLIQEGMIGLFKAVRDFDPGKGIAFLAFAKICVSRQILTAIKASSRQKHQPLNTSLPLDAPKGGGAHFANGSGDPESLLINRESLRDFGSFLQAKLSAMEYEILTLRLEGGSHAEIARAINKDVKSVDNALQRVRKKMTAEK